MEEDKEFYINFIDEVFQAWLDDDVRVVEELCRYFYRELHPELEEK